MTAPEQFAAARTALVHALHQLTISLDADEAVDALDAYLDAREAQAREKTLPRGQRAWGCDGPGS